MLSPHPVSFVSPSIHSFVTLDINYQQMTVLLNYSLKLRFQVLAEFSASVDATCTALDACVVQLVRNLCSRYITP